VAEFIPTDKAWKRVAKLLFPGEEVAAITERDAWLINRYYSPSDPPSDWWPGMPVKPPAELCAEVDRAYFRLSLQERVDVWFAAEGFDLTEPALSKEDFEASLAAHLPEERSLPKFSTGTIEKFVANYLKSESHPTMTDAREKWAALGYGATARGLLDSEYKRQAGSAGVSVKPGPRTNSAKI
jgi:hypothetical protein